MSGTPVIDIKPYVPYVDSLEARSPFKEKPEFKKVLWKCDKVTEWELIEKVIALDPRPGQEKQSHEEYGVTIAGYNIRFRFLVDHFEIISLVRLK